MSGFKKIGLNLKSSQILPLQRVNLLENDEEEIELKPKRPPPSLEPLESGFDEKEQDLQEDALEDSLDDASEYKSRKDALQVFETKFVKANLPPPTTFASFEEKEPEVTEIPNPSIPSKRYQSSDDDYDEKSLAKKAKIIDPLPPIDHDKIDYIEFDKDFYQEHAEITAMTDAQVNEFKRQLGIKVYGQDVVKPVVSFAHFNLDKRLVQLAARQGFTNPTPIQAQAVPIALSGRDVIGIAKTGSGKTAAYLWPMLTHMMDQPYLSQTDGPIGLILVPTRELAQQVYQEARKWAKVMEVNVAVVYGGASKQEQYRELYKGGHEILVATPGRLIDMIQLKATNLSRVTFLVLDEADRMFDLGFEQQVRSICNNVRPDRQTLLFSATWPKKVDWLARDVLTDPIKVVIGDLGVANEDVKEHFVILEDDSFKWDWLTHRLLSFSMDGQVIIFVTRKEGCSELALNLANIEELPNIQALHGDMTQGERDKVIRSFKSGECRILVATDLAGRGLDIPQIKTVINYDIARDVDSHIHRVGRTGRAGIEGAAYTLLTQAQDKFASELVKNMQGSRDVPADLLELAKKNPYFHRRGRGRARRPGLGSRRGRGGRFNSSFVSFVPSTMTE